MADHCAEAPQSRLNAVVYGQRLLSITPLLIAVFFGSWALRGACSSSIADFDAPSHALNGAFILDALRNSKLLHPVQYGYWYYSHFPALSLPYHPPIFPAFEAVVYAALGVNAFSARLSVAIATTIAVLLLSRLVRESHNSRLLATVVTASFFAMPSVQHLSATVMLELPALVFVLASLRFLLPEDKAFQTWRSLWFAAFAAAAIWTKQTVFLFFLPFVYVLISGRLRLLRSAYFWCSSFIVGVSAAGLVLLARELQWNGINQAWAKRSMLQYLAHNWTFYAQHRALISLILCLLCLLTYLLPGGKEDWGKDLLYIVWMVAVALVLLGSPAYSTRYMFFAIPPLLVLVYNGLLRLGHCFSLRYAWVLPATVCSFMIAYGLFQQPQFYLRGPNEAASFLHASGHRRVLFCGGTSNGAFIFAVRSHDPGLTTIVLRGDKLPDSTFTPQQLNHFVQQYGIDSVVLERTALPQAWDGLSASNLQFLAMERVLQMADTEVLRNGSLSIYRVLNPSTVPATSLQVPIPILGRDVEVQLPP